MAITAPAVAGGQQHYLAGLRAPCDARRYLRARCAAWGLPGLSDVAELVVSELVTNAVVHGGGSDVGLRVVRTPRSVIVMATDDSPSVPVASEPGEHGESGRGLAMVAALCGQWGWYFTGAGRKVVWAELLSSSLDT